MLKNARFHSMQWNMVRDLRGGRLAARVGLSPSQIRRLARKGIIPGRRRTKGGHWRFRACPALQDWINAYILKKNPPNRVPRAFPGYLRPMQQMLNFYTETRLEALAPQTAQSVVRQIDATIRQLEEKKQWLIRHFNL